MAVNAIRTRLETFTTSQGKQFDYFSIRGILTVLLTGEHLMLNQRQMLEALVYQTCLKEIFYTSMIERYMEVLVKDQPDTVATPCTREENEIVNNILSS